MDLRNERPRRDHLGALALTCLVLATLALASCARPAERAAEHATPEVVEGVVGSLSKPEVQAQIAEIAADPEVRRAAANLAATATDGVIAALSEEERQAELTELTGEYVAAASAAAAGSLGQELGVEMQRLIADSVDASIEEIASERNIGRIEALTAGLTDSVMRGVLTAVQQGAAPEVVRSLLHDSLRPGLISMLDEDMNRALGVTAYEISRQSVLGAEAALAGEQGGGGVLGRWFLTGPGAIAGWVLLLALLAGVILLALRARRLRQENERREAALVSLASALKATENRPWSDDLRETLRDQLRDQAGAEYLREVLRSHRDLRMGRHH